MPIKWSVDPKSYELAQHFLEGGTEAEWRSLSQAIQDAAENWCNARDQAIAEAQPPEPREPDSFETLGLRQADFI